MTAVALRNGQATADPRLDRIRHVDVRSLRYLVSDTLTDTERQDPRSYTWPLDVVLDQGPDGACVGFGISAELAAIPVAVPGITNRSALDLYYAAQHIDPWEGGAYPGAEPTYDGTSVTAGLEIARRTGLIPEYRWSLTIPDLYIPVGHKGPAVIGVDWKVGMMSPDRDGFIHATGEVVGGHCVCVIGVRIVRDSSGAVDLLRSYLVIQNSWGRDWGLGGRCHLRLVDLMVLWPGGDFAIPTVRAKGPQP